MKPVKLDVVGKKFGSFTVTDKYKQTGECPNRKTYWWCICDCGNEKWINRKCLKDTRANYCEKCRPSGIRNERLYHIYHGIKQRCYNPKTTGYEHYGGKGVVMCDEWLLGGYEVFKEWALAHGYKERCGLSIDRLDVNGNYEPSNCEWVTIAENTRRGDLGKVKSHTRLEYIYVIKPDGSREDIQNITQFARDNDLNLSGVSAAIHGNMKRWYKGYEFHSSAID